MEARQRTELHGKSHTLMSMALPQPATQLPMLGTDGNKHVPPDLSFFSGVLYSETCQFDGFLGCNLLVHRCTRASVGNLRQGRASVGKARHDGGHPADVTCAQPRIDGGQRLPSFGG